VPAYLDALLARAFESFPGEAYNRYREAMEDDPAAPRLFFEVSLLSERPWEHLRDEVYPVFARILKAKSLNPETGQGVVVAVFHRARCHLIRGQDFVRIFLEVEGLNAAAFHFRVLQWLKDR
jgi:hypothetical protein